MKPPRLTIQRGAFRLLGLEQPPSLDRACDCNQVGLIALVVSIFRKQRAAPTMGGPFFKNPSSYSPAAERSLLLWTILSASYSTPARPIGT